MALALTPRLLRRGLELFALISLAGVVVVLAVYGENVQAVARALLHLHWGWMVVGLGLASMDWLGGGTRLWVVARHVHPGVRLWDMIIAGGMSAWAAYLTPFQSGAGPTMMWVMRRAGVRLPEAMTSTFMTFVATVVFFATAGPLAIYLGAGKSLEQHNVILGITYYGVPHQPHDLRNPGHRDADRDGVPGLAAGCRALAGRPPRAQEPPDRGPHRAAARGDRPGA